MPGELSNFLLFAGSSHPKLAIEIAEVLGVELAGVTIERFPDNEIALRLNVDVRGKDVFVLQTIALNPNDYLMELLIMVDALKRASASSITAVIPYFGYARQDHKNKPWEPITARLVADMLVTAGVTRVVTMDLHSGQIEGFFDIPLDNCHGRSLLVDACKQNGVKNVIVAGPDIGSIKLVHAFAEEFGADIAVVDKRRLSATQVEVVGIIGDIAGKDVLLADDMCSTIGTLASAAKACREKGANRIDAVVTHGLFVDSALDKLNQSPIERLFVSNTIPLRQKCPKIIEVSVATLFANALEQIAR